MTKPVTAVALLLCRDRRLLSLDDPVSRFVPEFAVAASLAESSAPVITLRHLLAHTSGLGGSQEIFTSIAVTARDIARRPRLFAPGTRWQYSPGLNVIARVVEVASGRPFDRFLQEELFDPLGMKDTTFHPTPSQQARLARLYRPAAASGRWMPAESWINRLDLARPPNPSASLYSTAVDLACFYRMLLAGGLAEGRHFLSADSLREMTSNHTIGLQAGFSPGNAWGLGWELVVVPQGVNAALSPGTYGHHGAFGTQGWIDPQRGLFFLLLVQRVGFGDDVPNSALRARFQDAVMAAWARTQAIPASPRS